MTHRILSEYNVETLFHNRDDKHSQILHAFVRNVCTNGRSSEIHEHCRGHSFSTFAKFSEKLKFLTSYAHLPVCGRG